MIQPPPGGGGDDPNERLPRQHEMDFLDFYPTTDEEGEETVEVRFEERDIPPPPPAPNRPSIFANRSGSPRNLDLFQPQNNNAHNFFMNLRRRQRIDRPPPPPTPVPPQPEQDETDDRPDDPPLKKKKNSKK